eukprot:gnl/MRDRNA2_/MRDRNA2_149790_c0_seq1.p1 gnl/MRDRNA2_/MRDRNA2_149790_c0~~gnl/MRDRNA2_/MRDRNA2_149790_c0_seq1.p1  ORF type:complete len:569 (+),score=109.17 gnl/MRDRNA2_/MRDRNA2_149790_c0_seq1:142-1848(+)
MRFAKALQSCMVEQWSENYINYRQLKKLLRFLQGGAEHDPCMTLLPPEMLHSTLTDSFWATLKDDINAVLESRAADAGLPHLDREFETHIQQHDVPAAVARPVLDSMVSLSARPTSLDSDDLKCLFFLRLDREIQKASLFHNQKQEELAAHIAATGVGQKEKEMGTDPRTSFISYKKIMETHASLAKFAEMNYTAIFKIMKKFDKVCKTHESAWYMRNVECELFHIFDNVIFKSWSTSHANLDNPFQSRPGHSLGHPGFSIHDLRTLFTGQEMKLETNEKERKEAEKLQEDRKEETGFSFGGEMGDVAAPSLLTLGVNSGIPEVGITHISDSLSYTSDTSLESHDSSIQIDFVDPVPILIDKATDPLISWNGIGWECQRCKRPPRPKHANNEEFMNEQRNAAVRQFQKKQKAEKEQRRSERRRSRSLGSLGGARDALPVAVNFKETSFITIQFALRELLLQLNCSWNKDISCCPYHATIAVVKQWLQKFDAEVCDSSWLPNDKQCKKCLSMNRNDEPQCEVCGSESFCCLEPVSVSRVSDPYSETLKQKCTYLLLPSVGTWLNHINEL